MLPLAGYNLVHTQDQPFPSSASHDREHSCSHLTALSNYNVLCRLAFRISYRPCIFNLGNHVHAIDDVAEDDVLAVEMGSAGLCCDDEELAAVGIWTCLSQYVRCA